MSKSHEFLGYYIQSVHKHRVIIPSVFKKKFSRESLNQVVVTIGPGPYCTIAIFPLDYWHSTLERLEAGDEHSRRLRTNLIDFAMTEQELEGPGRVRISEFLLEKANITDSVLVKGQGHYLVLWKPEYYHQHIMENLSYHRESFTTNDY